jgi:hypothetical protein
MQQQGYNTMWLWLMAHNTISVNVHSKLGLNRIRKILREKLNYGFIKRKVEDVELSLTELLPNG